MADLPYDVLAYVFALAQQRGSCFHIRQVCSAWRVLFDELLTSLHIGSLQYQTGHYHHRFPHVHNAAVVVHNQLPKGPALLERLLEDFSGLTVLTKLELGINALAVQHTALLHATNEKEAASLQQTQYSLPAAITGLQRLRSLRILPDDDLCSAEHSAASASPDVLPADLCSLPVLESLCVHSLHLPRQHLSQLTSLKRLELHGNENLHKAAMHLSKLTGLTSLSLGFVVGCGNPNALVVDLLPTNCVMFSGLQRLAEAGGRLIKLQYTGAYLTLIPGHLRQWSNLEELDLSDNTLVLEPPVLQGHLRELRQLVRLNLHSNLLHLLPPEICNMTHLRDLDLGNNKMTELNSEISQLTNLTCLDISNNFLAELPESISALNALVKLSASGNKLSSLPSFLMLLTRLASLHMASNAIPSIPDSIANLASLTELDMSSNQLDTLPAALDALTQLRSFACGHNALQHVLCTWRLLIGVESLDVSEGLSKLDDGSRHATLEAIGRLSGLARLQAHSNGLTEVPEGWCSLTGLTSLDLSKNELGHIPADVSRLSLLQHLDVASNRLTSLPDAIFSLLTLRSLNASGNQLRALPERVHPLLQLRQLKLCSNSLASLPDALCIMSRLESLELASNADLQVLAPGLQRMPALRLVVLDRELLGCEVVRSLIRKGVRVVVGT